MLAFVLPHHPARPLTDLLRFIPLAPVCAGTVQVNVDLVPLLLVRPGVLPVSHLTLEETMRNVLSAIFVASSLAAGVAAQGQQPATQGQQPAARGQQPTTAQAAKVTISGCIQTAPPAAPEAGAVPSTTAASKFDLASAKVVSDAPVGTTGTAATATRYRLEGEEKTISPHLNHQVEITGTVSPAAATGAAGATAAPMLKVESLKMVAAKCP